MEKIKKSCKKYNNVYIQDIKSSINTFFCENCIYFDSKNCKYNLSIKNKFLK